MNFQNNQRQLDKKPINNIKIQKFQIVKISKNLKDFKKVDKQNTISK